MNDDSSIWHPDETWKYDYVKVTDDEKRIARNLSAALYKLELDAIK